VIRRTDQRFCALAQDFHTPLPSCSKPHLV